jgi:hypothetical protein
MPAIRRQASRPGAAKSKEKAEGKQAHAATHRKAGGPASEMCAASDHEGRLEERNGISKPSVWRAISCKLCSNFSREALLLSYIERLQN